MEYLSVKIPIHSLLTALPRKMGENRKRIMSAGSPLFSFLFCYYFYGNLTIKYLVFLPPYLQVIDVLSVVVLWSVDIFFCPPIL